MSRTAQNSTELETPTQDTGVFSSNRGGMNDVIEDELLAVAVAAGENAVHSWSTLLTIGEEVFGPDQTSAGVSSGWMDEVEEQPKIKKRREVLYERVNCEHSVFGQMLQHEDRLKDPTTREAKQFRNRCRRPHQVFDALLYIGIPGELEGFDGHRSCAVLCFVYGVIIVGVCFVCGAIVGAFVRKFKTSIVKDLRGCKVRKIPSGVPCFIYVPFDTINAVQRFFFHVFLTHENWDRSKFCVLCFVFP